MININNILKKYKEIYTQVILLKNTLKRRRYNSGLNLYFFQIIFIKGQPRANYIGAQYKQENLSKERRQIHGGRGEILGNTKLGTNPNRLVRVTTA